MSNNVNFDVHRLRIGQWQPSPIRSISVSASNLVAVGREDGEIEILEPENKFVQVIRITGATGFKLQGLCWSKHNSTGEERLFGISLRGFIFEVDFVNLSIKNICDTYSGAAWSIAAHPRDDIIAVGGEDGAVRYFKYTSAGKLDYCKTLPSSGTRVLSLCFHPTLPALYLGCSDGTIRCFDENNNRALLRMSGDIHYGLNFTPSIWSLAVLSDSTVVSGDSTGQVQIWDGNAGVLTTSFRQHEADVLCIAVSHDEHAIFASGVDGKVICLELPHSDSLGALSSDWIYTHSYRSHSHDVYTLTTCRRPKHLEHIPGNEYILLSGGLDAKLCMYAADNSDFSRQRPYYLPICPSNQQLVSSSSNYQTIAISYRKRIDLWSFQPSGNRGENKGDEANDSYLAARMQWSAPDHLNTAVLSNNGKLLVASINNRGLRAWHVSNSAAAPSSSSRQPLQLQKLLNVPAMLSSNKSKASAISFASNDEFLAVYSVDMHAVLLFAAVHRPDSDGKEEKKESKGKKSKKKEDISSMSNDSSVALSDPLAFESHYSPVPITLHLPQNNTLLAAENADGSHSSKQQLKHKLFNIVKAMKFSHDNKYLAVSHASDDVTVFDVQRKAVHWTLPSFKATIAELKFLTNNRLLVLPSNNLIQLFDVEKLRYLSYPSSTTSDNVNVSVNSSVIPRQVSCGLYFPLAGVANNNNDQLLFYGPMQCVYVDLNLPIPAFPLMVGGKYSSIASNDDAATSNAVDHEKQQGGESVSFNEEDNSTGKSGKKSKRKKQQVEEDETDAGHGKKQKSNGESEAAKNPNFAIIENYRNIMHVGRVQYNTNKDDNENSTTIELVVIENPWFRFAEQLPETLARKRYGT